MKVYALRTDPSIVEIVSIEDGADIYDEGEIVDLPDELAAALLVAQAARDAAERAVVAWLHESRQR